MFIGHVKRNLQVMIPHRFLTTLRRVVYVDQSRVAQNILRVCQCQAFSDSSIYEEVKDDKKRPKTVPVPKITLQSPDNSIIVTVLEDAQRMAKRRDLTLVKVSDPDNKTQRAFYKLINNSALLEDTKEIIKDTSSKDRKKTKGTKLIYISMKIAEYDLRIKTKNAVKLLNKGHKVKFVITLDGAKENMVRDIIEETVKNESTIQQMPSKKNIVLLLITPLNKSTDSCVNNKKETV